MKKKTIIIVILIFLALGVYLNLSYSHFYNYIKKMNLEAPKIETEYNLNSDKISSSSITYTALGDSLTAAVGVDDYQKSYPFLLAKNLAKNNNVKLKTYAWPGLTTSDLKNKFLSKAIEAQPDIITLLIGVNDVHNNTSADNFKTDYEQIITELKNKTKAKIFLINAPLIGSDAILLPPYNYYFNIKTEQINSLIKELANKYNLNYIDLYSQTLNLKNNSYYSADEFHPSADGYALWAKIIYDHLNF